MRVSTSKQSRHLYPFLLLLCILGTNCALKCRTDDGPSDAELKRVARTCMHKVSEGSYNRNGYNSNTGSATGYTSTNTNYYGQQNYGQNSNGKNYGSSYDNTDADDTMDEQNYRRNIYERDYNDDMLRQRNRERMQNNRLGRTRRSTTNNDRGATSSGRYDQTNSSNNGRNSNGNGSSNNNSNNQRSSSSSGGSNGNTNKNKNNNNYNNSSNDRGGDHQSDGGCIVHCFFDELHMLNSDDYPDKYKVSYLLTKDLRDHALRAFYTETIQDCFHYLESQRRREKCQFSRDLISCMTEYAKANCDDWEDYNIIFN